MSSCWQVVVIVVVGFCSRCCHGIGAEMNGNVQLLASSSSSSCSSHSSRRSSSRCCCYQAMGIETEEDVQLLASYFLKHRAAAREDDTGNRTVRLTLPLDLTLVHPASSLVLYSQLYAQLGGVTVRTLDL